MSEEVEPEGGEYIESPDEAKERLVVCNAVKNLSVHFDTVEIICTKHIESDRTELSCAGTGNYYARIGSVAEWLKQRRKTP